MATKNLLLATTIFACSLSLVKAGELPEPGDYPENTTKPSAHLSINSQTSYARLFVLKHRDFFNPRHK